MVDLIYLNLQKTQKKIILNDNKKIVKTEIKQYIINEQAINTVFKYFNNQIVSKVHAIAKNI